MKKSTRSKPQIVAIPRLEEGGVPVPCSAGGVLRSLPSSYKDWRQAVIFSHLEIYL
jgi:hypothetical protein